MDLTNYKTAAMADLSRISQINLHLQSGDEFTGYVEVLDQNLEIGEVGDAMAGLDERGETFDYEAESLDILKMKAWTKSHQITTHLTAIHSLITENHPDEYVYVIALPPFYLIKRKTPTDQEGIDAFKL